MQGSSLPSNTRLLYLSWLTLLGMSAMGIVIIGYYQKLDVSETLTGGRNHYLQAVAGVFYGSLSALLAQALIKIKRFSNTRGFFEQIIQDLNPSFFNILFYSLCAAVGEEILFRAGIQPVVGIWPVAIVFVWLHGYITPANLNLTIYGAFLIVITAGFGYLFKFFGLFSAITAHFVYDVAMFSILKYAGKAGNS